MKGLRRIHPAALLMDGLFQTFPVYEGIKTAVGIFPMTCWEFQTFPVYEGIKTASRVALLLIPCSKLSLFMKGLRRDPNR